MRPLLSFLACVTALVLTATPAARAQVAACPAPVGAACGLWAFPGFLPEVLAGGESGAALLAGVRGLSRDAVPLVPLAVDPGDGPHAGSLSARLNARQQALLGCGPLWGTVCEASGVNLLNADASTIVQSWFLGERAFYLTSGSVSFPSPGGGLLLPSGSTLAGWPATEMAVLSFNLQLLLVAFSGGLNPDPTDPGHFDPRDPYAYYDPNDPATYGARGKCSFLQPQYCASIQSFFDIVQSQPQSPLRATGNASFGRREFVWAVDRCAAAGQRGPRAPVRFQDAAGILRATLCPRR